MEITESTLATKNKLAKRFPNVPEAVLDRFTPLFDPSQFLTFDELATMHQYVQHFEREAEHSYASAVKELEDNPAKRDMQAIRKQLERNDFSGLSLVNPVPTRDNYGGGNLACSLGFAALGFMTGAALGWIGFVNGVLALLGWGIGSSLGKSLDESKYLSDLESYKRAVLFMCENREQEHSKARREYDRVSEDYRDLLSGCRNAINLQVEHENSIAQEDMTNLEQVLFPSVEMETSTANAKAGGKPHISWNIPDEDHSKLLARAGGAVYFRIYRGTGSIITEAHQVSLSPNVELIYNKPASESGLFVDRSVSPNKTYVYYFAVHISMDCPRYDKATDTLDQSIKTHTVIADTETLTIPVWRTTKEVLEHQTTVEQARLQRKKFESKYATALGKDEGQDPISIIKEEMAGIKKRSEKMKHIQAAIDDARRELVDLNVPEDEIEEIIEELLMKLEQ